LWKSTAAALRAWLALRYTPRIREGFLAYDDTTYGWHVLAGQA